MQWIYSDWLPPLDRGDPSPFYPWPEDWLDSVPPSPTRSRSRSRAGRGPHLGHELGEDDSGASVSGAIKGERSKRDYKGGTHNSVCRFDCR